MHSRFTSWMRKSSFRPTGSSPDSMVRSCAKWLRSRTVSSSTAILSAKIAASVRILLSSMVVDCSTSRIFVSSLSRYSATVWGERSSTLPTTVSMVSALPAMSWHSFSPSTERICRWAAKASSSTAQMSAEIISRSSSALVTVSTSGNFASATGDRSLDSTNIFCSRVKAS